MPSNFLKDRLPAFQKEVAGATTVSYYKLTSTTRDSFTGTVNNAAAYAASGIGLPALVDFSPSDNVRAMVGADINFDATVTIALAHLEAKSITLKVGDALVLPGDADYYYVEKVIPTHQVDDNHLERLAAVSHRLGRV
jgi:hypothetical protein